MTALPFSTAAGPAPCPHGEITSPLGYLGASPHLPAPLTPPASFVTRLGLQETPASTFQQKTQHFPQISATLPGAAPRLSPRMLLLCLSSRAGPCLLGRRNISRGRQAPAGGCTAQTRALLAPVASVLFIRLLQKHLDGWRSVPCALTESGSHEPTLGRTKGRSVWVGAARRGCCTTPSRASRQQNQPELLLLAPGRAPSSVSLPPVAPPSLYPDAGLLQRSR